MIASFTKDPDDVLDYSVDWTRWLDGDTVATSTWLASVPAGLTPSNDDEADGVTVVFLAGGTDGVDYKVANRITTAGGRTVEVTIQIRVRDSDS